MTYEEGILGIPKQFEYEPKVINSDKLRPFQRIIVLGMGGSRLAADILNMYRPDMDIHIHSDFDLPKLSDQALGESLIIANSYSGNTIEVVSGAMIAVEKNLNLAVVAAGGELAAMAQARGIPHIILPESPLPPRMMLGHDLLALAALVGIQGAVCEPCRHIDAGALRARGEKLAQEIGSKTPLIYTSTRFNELGYIWKVMFNETAQAPAFSNRFPEIDHNEVAGFRLPQTASQFHAIILKDRGDTRLIKRMDAVAALFRENSLSVSEHDPEGSSAIEQIISSVILAHWTALASATASGIDPLMPVIIEKLKKDIQ